MNAASTLGRHKLTTRFTSIVRICVIGYLPREQLQTVYDTYLQPVLSKHLSKHPVWFNPAKIHAIACSMVKVYEQVRERFSPDDHSHYLFSPRDLTRWVLAFLRYDLASYASDTSSDHVMEVFTYEAQRLFRDRLVGVGNRQQFDSNLMSIVHSDWSTDVMVRQQIIHL